MASAAERRARLAATRLYFVTDQPAAVPAAIDGGADLIQLRMKDAADDEVLAAGGEVADICGERGVLFIVNDRPDLAAACGADGVHVGQDDMSVEAARTVVSPAAIVGISTHSREQIDAAERSGADYVVAGPIWETPTKEGRPATGLDLISYAADRVTKPWFAIGGIDRPRLDSVLDAGATRIVVVRAIQAAADPRAAAAELREALEREPVGGKAQ